MKKQLLITILFFISTSSFCETWPTGGVYHQTSTLDFLNSAGKAVRFRPRTGRAKTLNYFKIIGTKGGSYIVQKTNSKGAPEKPKQTYTVAKKWFHQGALLGLSEAANDLVGSVSNRAPRPCDDPKHCGDEEENIPKPAKKAQQLINIADFKVQQSTLDLIIASEGCIRCGYHDHKQFSWGYGTVISNNKSLWKSYKSNPEYIANNKCLEQSKRKCTTFRKKKGYDSLRRAKCSCGSGNKTHANKELKSYIKKKNVIAAIKRKIKVPLTQAQLDVVASFAYNLGNGKLSSATFVKLLNKKKYKEAALSLTEWIKVGGKKSNGLRKRRAYEHYIFTYGTPPPYGPYDDRALAYYHKIHSKKATK